MARKTVVRTSDTDDGKVLEGVTTWTPEQLRADPVRLAKLLKSKDGTPGKDVALRVHAEDERAKSAAPLVAEATKLARSWRRAESRAGQITRQVAEILVELRQIYRDPKDDARPDMAGRSPEYKAAAAAIYDRAGFDPARKSTMQASVRHHLSAVLREVMREKLGMGDNDFAFYGLNPADRNTLRRQSTLPALRLDERDPGKVFLGVAHYARRALEAPAASQSPADLPATEREEFRETLEAIRARADELLDELDAAG